MKVLESPAILTEGAVVERLRRMPGVRLDPDVAHASFLYDSKAASLLAAVYSDYLAISRVSGLPMLVFTPTWRANPERLARAGLANRDVNADAVHFLEQAIAENGNAPGTVFIGGLMGCRGDAYRPEEALPMKDAAEFHAPQARALAQAQPDFLFAATLPAASEARGLAQAMAACRLPYFLSFLIDARGQLLDGTPVWKLIEEIDAETSPSPAGYFVNCVHPDILAAALEAQSIPRLIGFQGNTSRKAPGDLEGMAELDSAEPEEFAQRLLALRRFGLRILGGCCGTDARHIRSLAYAWRR